MGLSFIDCVRMAFTKVPILAVRRCLNRAALEEAPLESKQLETHYLAGGDIRRVTDAWIRNRQRRGPLEWDYLCAWDLAGEDPVRMVDVVIDGKLNPRARDFFDQLKVAMDERTTVSADG